MKFAPKTREETYALDLLPKGIYSFEVIKAENKESKSGNAMIEILIKVWDEKGKPYPIFDYLMESFESKLRHFCYAIGHGEMSEKGEFDCELALNKTGVCRIYIKEDKSGQYAPKNAVADYLLPMDNSPAQLHQKDDSFKDDELPF